MHNGQEIWKILRDIGYHHNDWECESSALLEIVNMPGVSYEEISHAAYRINKYYMENGTNDDLSRNYLIKAVISKMEGRIKEANANDLSRLAWLFMNLQDPNKALIYGKMGLTKDKSNVHCQRLVSKLTK